MKEQIISFETSKLAKEKGFDQNEFYQIYWEGKQEKTPFSKALYYKKLIEDNILDQETSIQLRIYAAPTQALLQKWLREVYNIYVIINTYRIQENKWYKFFISQMSKVTIKSDDYDTYEEALEQGLQEALKLIPQAKQKWKIKE